MIMESAASDNNEILFGGMTAWALMLLLLAFTFPYLKRFFSFVLGKLYEFFIQRNALEL